MALAFLKTKLPVIPDYELDEKIGQGSCGAVYKGFHVGTGQAVAVKVIPTATVQNEALLLRFEQEFRAASLLTHPNIVRVLDFGRDEKDAYLVMEFVDGINLGLRIKRAGRLPEDEAVRIVTQVAQALQYAHERGLVHRDVKPDNILIREDGQVKLADFGLVKDLLGEANLTDPTTVLGTPQFMAPEQYDKPQAVDARADVYSLAATLYLAVTGEMPFGTTKSFVVLMAKVLKGAIKPPRDVVATLSPEVDAAIRRGMSADPEKRPASCLDFAYCLKPKKSKSKSPKSGADQATRQASSAGTERRAALRFAAGMGTFCVVNTSVHDDPGGTPDTWPATVEDISKTGLGIVLARRLEPGTTLSFELAKGQEAPALVATVQRVIPKGFGHWLIGCQFTQPITEENLRTLLTKDEG